MPDVSHLIIFFFRLMIRIVRDNTVQGSYIFCYDNNFLGDVPQFQMLFQSLSNISANIFPFRNETWKSFNVKDEAMFLPLCIKLTIKTSQLMLQIRLSPLVSQEGDIFLADFINLFLKNQE